MTNKAMTHKDNIVQFKKKSPKIPSEFLYSTSYRPLYCDNCSDLIGIENIHTGEKDFDGNYCRKCGKRIIKPTKRATNGKEL